MQLKYGNYPFDAGSCGVTSRCTTEVNDGGQPYSQTFTVGVDGYLTTTVGAVNPQADLTTKSLAMQLALSVPYRDLILYQDNGAPSHLILLNRGSLTGVVVTRGPDFTDSTGAEYVNWRKFSFEASATYPLPAAANYYLSFTETVSTQGGGAVFAVQPAKAGGAQKQQVWGFTPYLASQTGTATGYLKYPPVAPPLWAADLTQTPKITRSNPKRRGQGYEGYSISWEYQYASVKAFPNPIPTLWR